jgi:hypothetical protein
MAVDNAAADLKPDDTIVADKGAGSAGGAAPADKVVADDKSASTEVADKGSTSKAADASGTSLMDDADDAPDVATPKAAPKAAADGKVVEEDKPEPVESGLAPERKWRERAVERLTKGLDETMPAAQLARRREALMAELRRFKSADEALAHGIVNGEKVRGGLVEPGPDATQEEKAAYRAAKGIPDEPDKYEIPKVAGMQWGDEHKPMLDTMKKVVHEAGGTQAQMNKFAEGLARFQTEQAAKYAEETALMDREDKGNAQDKLRARWGLPEYKPRIQLMDRYLNDAEALPDGLGKKMLTARYLDENGRWRRMINDPDFAEYLGDQAHARYGEGALITGDGRAAINNRKAEIEKIMSTDINKYYQDGLDVELRALNEREERARRR